LIFVQLNEAFYFINSEFLTVSLIVKFCDCLCIEDDLTICANLHDVIDNEFLFNMLHV
jgi:hypothetical protein